MQTWLMVSSTTRVRLETRFVHILPLNCFAAVDMREHDQAVAIGTVKRWAYAARNRCYVRGLDH